MCASFKQEAYNPKLLLLCYVLCDFLARHKSSGSHPGRLVGSVGKSLRQEVGSSNSAFASNSSMGIELSVTSACINEEKPSFQRSCIFELLVIQG